MTGVSRRRGQELEDALLAAAWEELLDAGYARFTAEGVAARAGTSRPVIARRWPNRADLAIAAIKYYGRTTPMPVPDTGSVRDDLIEGLRAGAKGRIELAALFSVHMGAFYAETGRTPADLRTELLGAREQPLGLEVVIQRGIDRGELDADRMTPRLRSLPGDLLRHEILMTLRPISDEAILEIVDQIFLPLTAKRTANEKAAKQAAS